MASMWIDLLQQLRTAEHPGSWNQLGLVPGSAPPLLWAELRAGYRELLRARSLRLVPEVDGACRALLRQQLGPARPVRELGICAEWLARGENASGALPGDVTAAAPEAASSAPRPGLGTDPATALSLSRLLRPTPARLTPAPALLGSGAGSTPQR